MFGINVNRYGDTARISMLWVGVLTVMEEFLLKDYMTCLWNYCKTQKEKWR